MKEYWKSKNHKLYLGMNIDVLKTIETNSIDSIVTDPPYELGFMGKSWDATGIAYDEKLWREVLRVLKPGGHLIAFSSARTYHWIAMAIEKAGFDIRDQLMWMYGSGFPKSHNIAKAIDKQNNHNGEIVGVAKGMGSNNTKSMGNGAGINAEFKKEYTIRELSSTANQWEGWGTALKPAHEPMVLARKPLEKGLTIAKNVLKWGVGGINIDACRIIYDKNNIPIPQLANGKTQVNSKKTMFDGQSLNKSKTKATIGGDLRGRFPANIIHDGSNTIKNLFPDTKCGKMKQKIKGGIFNVYGKQYPRDVETIGDNGNASRYFYEAKCSKRDRNEGLNHFKTISASSIQGRKEGSAGSIHFGSNGKLKANAYAGISGEIKNIHPTVKPTSLMMHLIQMITPVNGTFIDIFNGSGSTLKAAELLNQTKNYNLSAIGIDISKEYLEISKARIKYAEENPYECIAIKKMNTKKKWWKY